MGGLRSVSLFQEMPYPNVIARERECGAEEGGDEPKQARGESAPGTGMHGINPAAQFVGRLGFGIHDGRRDLARTAIESVFVGRAGVARSP